MAHNLSVETQPFSSRVCVNLLPKPGYYLPANRLTQTYLSWRDGLTHENLVVGGELRRVVVDVLHPDIHTHFGVLVVTACTHTVHNQNYSAAHDTIPISVRAIRNTKFVGACLWLRVIAGLFAF